MEESIVKFFHLLSEEVKELPKGLGNSKLISQVLQDSDVLADTINNVADAISNSNYSEVDRINKVLKESQERLTY